MIQEKDFLYRVPVKTAPITTPRGQIINPEILVDLEGGEFMHGNILDANSTNKLINQSVKDAVDDKFIENGYVTKDLLEAETSARTKGDEDLGAKIQAEQTRAEGKEKEISDKLAIVDGDSNTEGSFRKAIADVIAAAPEDLDTLKEIADKLAGNDDLHTALNQAITEKADASALANEVTRATGAESGLQAAIATKADAAALSNYVLTTALNQQVDTLNAAISAKQDKPDDGNMFFQVEHDSVSGCFKQKGQLKFTHDDNDSFYASISPSGIYCMGGGSSDDAHFCSFTPTGIRFSDKTDKDIPTAGGKFINVNDLASADNVSSLRAGLSRKQDRITVNEVDTTDIETADITRLRTIVINLINALNASDLIRETITLE